MLSGEGSGFDSQFLHGLIVEMSFSFARFTDIDIHVLLHTISLGDLDSTFKPHTELSSTITFQFRPTTVHPLSNRFPLPTHPWPCPPNHSWPSIVRVQGRWCKVRIAHDVLTETVNSMLHVQFLDAWRDLFHLLVMTLLLSCSESRDIGIHGRRDMKSDCVHAM